jgi:hypothetical protein
LAPAANDDGALTGDEREKIGRTTNALPTRLFGPFVVDGRVVPAAGLEPARRLRVQGF